MEYLTVVIEYKKEDQPPAITGYMDCLGGKIIAVQFNNALDAKDEANHE